MATASLAKPFISGILPQNRTARLAMQVGIAIVGSLFLTLTAKTKVFLGPVDLNLGTLGIFLIAALFGSRLGLATILLYMAEGAAGLPVFQSSPEKGVGLLYMLGTTGGYLAGYVVAGAVVGWAADRGFDRNPFKIGAAMAVGEIAIMGLGFAWLATLIGSQAAYTAGVVPFLLGDAIKIALAASVVAAVRSLRA
ncbi:biotin transporter BioY [Tianweitania sp. BSSL-BM11]|uniref:Biotin transporter n=1 Tax=Tianweitania aestuarii TaxID=2814886 RepID=A0ABS5RRY3_9HYPH|nr:biotin transporter BioY [Tianweitania aestuarii]MBS9719813.1 biotin transporter BioY [Tianweitania aestuarii]